MSLIESNRGITKVQNEKLCWTRYDWSATSREEYISGEEILHYYPTRTQLTELIIARVAQVVQLANVPWDPFNATFIIKRRRDKNPFVSPSTGELYE
jgi:hypothetical protein